MEPTIVARKIASNRHALTVIPSGTGNARMAAAVSSTAPHLIASSRPLSGSSTKWLAAGAGGPSPGGLNEDAGAGGAGVTVIGPNMWRPRPTGYEVA